jgi:hypothetical protein
MQPLPVQHVEATEANLVATGLPPEAGQCFIGPRPCTCAEREPGEVRPAGVRIPASAEAADVPSELD